MANVIKYHLKYNQLSVILLFNIFKPLELTVFELFNKKFFKLIALTYNFRKQINYTSIMEMSRYSMSYIRTLH